MKKEMQDKLAIFQIDAFTDKVFGGNPAAVCVLDSWIGVEKMQKIADENNLAETAFVVKKDNKEYEIRWFTPTIEVDLCGHATLAAAHVLFHYFNHSSDTINFHSHASGLLSVTKNDDNLSLNFPIDEYQQMNTPQTLIDAFSIEPTETYRGKANYLLVFLLKNKLKKPIPT